MKNSKIVNKILNIVYNSIYPLNKIFRLDNYNELEHLLYTINNNNLYILDPYLVKGFKFFKYGIIISLREDFNQREYFDIKIAIPFDTLEYLKLKYS